MTKENLEWKKDLKSLTDIVEDINQKMNHIVEQTKQIYFALSCLDDIRKYRTNSDYNGYANEENGD